MGKYKTPITVIDILGLVVTRRIKRIFTGNLLTIFLPPDAAAGLA